MTMDDGRKRVTHILVVEDDDVDVKNIRRAFERGRLTNPLYFARDGIEGLERLRDGSVPAERRIVLLDINMPRMNGLEFLREVRADAKLKHTPITPIVILTTSNDERDRFEAYGEGVAGYLLKPVTFGGFVELMSAMNLFWSLTELP
jgi:CheY-like chemotaxis protein